MQAWSNVTLPDAPPAYYWPDETGFAVLPDKTSWTLGIDQSNVPVGAAYGVWVEFLVGTHWYPDAGSDDFQGGPIELRTGGTTPFNYVRSSIGSVGEMRAYPVAARLRVTLMQPWLFPSIQLTME